MSHYSLAGSIELICGPMFSGKTEELIRLMKRAEIARQKVQIFKPSVDTRYDKKNVVAHDGTSLEAIAVENPIDIISILNGPKFDGVRVVGIDEVQFFSSSIVDVVLRLSNRGHRVICAGLDQDFLGHPFGPIGDLLAISDKVIKLSAVCTICGGIATKTYRKNLKDGEQFLLGGTNLYEARCRHHFDSFDFDAEELNDKLSERDISEHNNVKPSQEEARQ